MIKGLNESLKIIEEEIGFAKEVNSQMAFGMLHVKELIKNRIKQLEEKNSQSFSN